MTAVPRALKFAVTALMVVLVAVAVGGAATSDQHVVGAVLGALFLIVYLGGAAYASSAHENSDTPIGMRRKHGVAVAWLLVLTTLWIGLLLVSDSAMWLAFPLILLQIGVLGTAWGALIALATTIITTAVSVSRLQPGDSPTGALLGPLLGGVIAFVTMWGIMEFARESKVRQQALDELQKTRTLLAQAEEDRVVIRERQRLAGEIHDTLSQGLSATAMLLRAAQSTTDAAIAAALVTQALDATEENLGEARRITMTLTPRELATARLPTALRALCDSHSSDSLNVDLELSARGIDLTLPQEAALLRVAQSSLANVQEHSSATRAVVRLITEGNLVTLEVSDNGHGFRSTPKPNTGRGVGLRVMQSRMADIRGTLDVVSTPDGTNVRATLPEAGPAHEDARGRV